VRHIDDYANEMYQCQLVTDLSVISLGIFTYISGYLLASTNTIFNSITDIKRFLIKRVLRIYPLYALALLIFYLLSIVNSQQLYSGLLLYNVFTGDTILTLWFISMIMFYYILFVALNYKYNSMRFLFISTFILLLLLIEKIIVKKSDGSLLLYFPSFTCGILAQRYSNYLKLSIKKTIFILGIFLGILCLSLNDLIPSKASIMTYNMMIISITSISMFFLNKAYYNNIITNYIINLSYASFCMYLTHRIIFKISLIIYKPRDDIATLVYLYLVAIPIIFVVSFFIQRFYDKLINVYFTNRSLQPNSP